MNKTETNIVGEVHFEEMSENFSVNCFFFAMRTLSNFAFSVFAYLGPLGRLQ